MLQVLTNDNYTSYYAAELIEKQKNIVISNSNGHHFIDQDSILYLKAESNYCNIYLVDGTRILCSRTLKSIFHELDENLFIRSHNSIVFNWKMVKHINNTISEVKLSNGVIVPISRAKKNIVKQLINCK